MKGNIVIISLASPDKEDRVLAYFEKIVPGAPMEQVRQWIRELPWTVFKNVEEKASRDVIVNLQKLGADACFVPLDSMSGDVPQKPKKQTKLSLHSNVSPRVAFLVIGLLLTFFFGFTFFYLAKHKPEHIDAGDPYFGEDSPWKMETQTTAWKYQKPVGIALFCAPEPGADRKEVDFLGALEDVATVVLSREKDVRLVDRSLLDEVLEESEMSLAHMSRGGNAEKLRSMTGASLMVIGTFITIENKQSLILKAVDTASGVLRDIVCHRIEPDDLDANVQRVVDFVHNAIERDYREGIRKFIAVGHFGMSSRSTVREDKAYDIQEYFIKRFSGKSDVDVVHREAMGPLIKETGLSLVGLTEDAGSSGPVQLSSAFIIVSGSYETDNSEIFLWVEVKPYSLPFPCPFPVFGNSWPEVLQKAGDNIDKIVKTNHLNWRKKFQVGPDFYYRKGRQASRISFLRDSDNFPQTGPRRSRLYYPIAFKKLQVTPSNNKPLSWLREAINSFEIALYMDPNYYDAMLLLSVCLRHPLINEPDRAEQLLNRIIKDCPDPQLRYLAALTIGVEGQITFSPEDAKVVFNPEYVAHQVHDELTEMKKEAAVRQFLLTGYPEEDGVRLAKAYSKSIRAWCESVVWRKKSGTFNPYESNVDELCKTFYDFTSSAEKSPLLVPFRDELFVAIQQENPALVVNFAACSPIEYLGSVEMGVNYIDRIERGEIGPFAPKYFHESLKKFLFSLSSANTHPGAARRIGEYLLDHIARNTAEKYMSSKRYYRKADPVRLCLAFAYHALGENDQAATQLHELEGRTVVMPGPGPWGTEVKGRRRKVSVSPEHLLEVWGM